MQETDYIEKLRSLWPAAEGEETTSETMALADEAVHAWPNSAKLWCMRGNLIELGAEDIAHELSEALVSFERALAADSKCVEAYEEIGDYYDAVMDDEERAKPFFHKAAVLKDEGSQ